ncbi:MAG TPA: IPT/TIG domain-containing protein [Desulfuromonadaceae bacterium]|jgi:hypothetical protein
MLLTTKKWASIVVIIVNICLLIEVPTFAAQRPQRVKSEASLIPPVAAPTILSIIPAQAEPNQKVTIFGSAFGDKVSAFLGSQEIVAKVTEGKQLEFIVPSLPAGIYALYLKRGDGATGRAYNFTILPMRPILTDLNPSRISACAEGREREVTATGQNFSDSSFLMLDGAVIRSRLISSESIAFTLPQVPGGLHQIVVKNSPENASVPLALSIETKPEVSHVSVGNEYVNYYELIIEGKNFQQNSAIYVDGQRIGGRGGQEVAEREKLIYVDCTRLIYQRYPYTPVNKDFHVQVVNPGGEGSQVVNVTAP